MSTRSWTRWVLLGMTACLAELVACSSNTSPPTSPPVPTIGRPTTTVPSTVVAARELPKDCAAVVGADEVAKVVGHAIPGVTSRILGVAEPKIGRTGRIDCYYGVPTGQPVTAAPLIVGLSAYADDGTAQRRVKVTVDQERAKGGKTNDLQLGDERAVLVIGPAGRMLVAARGRNTVTVSINNGVVPDDKSAEVLSAIAQRVLTSR